jgi:predicted Zn-dependent protease
MPVHDVRNTLHFGKRIAIAASAIAVMTMSGCLASTQQEVQLGADYAAQINRQMPLISDPEVTRYINLLGDSLASVVDQRSLAWHFYVVDQPDINAFALPGGYVYVNRGLIERAQNLSQLAGVMGHEIGHVIKRHSVKQMQQAQGANIGATAICVFAPSVCNSELGSAALQVGAAGTFAKFSRDDEAEADQEGVLITTRAGIDPRGIPAMFNILLQERKTNPGPVEMFMASHPLEEDRVVATNATISKIDPVILSRLTVDTPGFEAFKRRLASLPHAPPVKK